LKGFPHRAPFAWIENHCMIMWIGHAAKGHSWFN
jgi:hypothetical protein